MEIVYFLPKHFSCFIVSSQLQELIENFNQGMKSLVQFPLQWHCNAQDSRNLYPNFCSKTKTFFYSLYHVLDELVFILAKAKLWFPISDQFHRRWPGSKYLNFSPTRSDGFEIFKMGCVRFSRQNRKLIWGINWIDLIMT